MQRLGMKIALNREANPLGCHISSVTECKNIHSTSLAFDDKEALYHNIIITGAKNASAGL